MADQLPENDPLNIFLPPGLEEPWIKTFFRNIREAINPVKLPPLEITSRPVEVKGSLLDEPSLFQSIRRGIKDALAPPPPPLELTSRPVEVSGDTFISEEPLYKSIFRNVKEVFFPVKLPPLEVTSKPVQVKDMWGLYGMRSSSPMISLAVHVGIVAILFFVLSATHVLDVKPKDNLSILAPNLDAYKPTGPAKTAMLSGGGGGGDRSPIPAAKGKLPKLALRQFVPPTEIIVNEHPKLAMDPSIIMPPDAVLPNVNMPNFGDPLAKAGILSNGSGSGGGIGSGSGGGIGSGRGGGLGPGEGGGFGGGAFRVGGGVSAPQVLYKVDPEYSEEARKAKYSGTVTIQLIVDKDGAARNIRVVRSLGLGLDEKAIEAVNKWRFKPGFKNGQAVAVIATIEVNFRLL